MYTFLESSPGLLGHLSHFTPGDCFSGPLGFVSNSSSIGKAQRSNGALSVCLVGELGDLYFTHFQCRERPPEPPDEPLQPM